MKKERIKNVTVHTVPITPQKWEQASHTLSRIYAEYTAKQLDDMGLSDRQKADILKELLKSKQN